MDVLEFRVIEASWGPPQQSSPTRLLMQSYPQWVDEK